MRQSVAVLLLSLGMAVFLAGCGFGGGGDESATDTSITNTTRTTAAPSVGRAVEEVLLTQLVTTQDTPEEFLAAMGEARPVAILFYVPGNADDSKVLETFKTVQADFPEFTFLTYDYKNPVAYGDLSLLLQVNYPPEIVLIDRAGAVQYVWNGYVDEGTLKQCLINVGQG